MNAADVIKQSTVEGNTLFLPKIQLDRKDYLEVKKKLELIGGKWKGGKVSGFVFATDPSDLIGKVASGENVNLKKDFQFFHTPEPIAARLINLACICDDDYILEPSAGQGHLIVKIRNHFDVKIDACELMPVNIEILLKKGIEIIGTDFLSLDASYNNAYDRVIANPPFSNNQDIIHLKKMYEVCRPGGTIVSVMSIGWMFNGNKFQTEFRKWIGVQPCMSDTSLRVFAKSEGSETFARQNDQGYDEQVLIEMLKEGDFSESGTKVRTCIVVINKR